MSTAEQTSTTTRLFAGVPIPSKVAAVIKQALHHYQKDIVRAIPAENWHLTLVFIGEVVDQEKYISKLRPVMENSFVPTATITHLGPGLKSGQLWAYINPTPALTSLREQMIAHLRKSGLPITDASNQFVPHIRLADLSDHPNKLAVADSAANATFAIKAGHIFASLPGKDFPQYKTLSRVYFTP